MAYDEDTNPKAIELVIQKTSSLKCSNSTLPFVPNILNAENACRPSMAVKIIHYQVQAHEVPPSFLTKENAVTIGKEGEIGHPSKLCLDPTNTMMEGLGGKDYILYLPWLQKHARSSVLTTAWHQTCSNRQHQLLHHGG
ncbi:hypothetical protein PanWU01x14_205150 [Parasponia andersonii]|uniref:Uncharacterized protein n=1 Tax=Parasponia andersonii TaxID=3476 RepID=A0A2P5BW38_PARAD|nr:hypothetical protein PanWU01x14_205150 [Parasponia andersonii]